MNTTALQEVERSFELAFIGTLKLRGNSTALLEPLKAALQRGDSEAIREAIAGSPENGLRWECREK